MLNGINHINLSVANLERSFSFYRDILGLKPLCKHSRGAYFSCGKDWICLSLKEYYRKISHDDYTHLAFSVAATDFIALSRQITASGAMIFQKNESEGESLYFCDPDGHQLEIHIGDWESRILYKKANPGNWQNVEFFV